MSVKFSKPNIKETDLNLVKKVIRSGWLTHGKNTSLFEQKFKSYTKSKYSVTVSSCTAALHLSCLALNLKKGDEVIVPAMSHTATSHAVEYTGAKTVFVDVNHETGNIDIAKVLKKITKRTKAIIVVHMAGFSIEIDLILRVCKKYKLKFELLSDEKKVVLKKYGVWGKKVFMGKKYMGIIRTTILINAKGKVHKIWNNVRVKDHAKEVLDTIKNI